MTAEEALAIATKTTPAPVSTDPPALPAEFELGQSAAVVPVDYGLNPVRGELVVCSAREYAIRRHDEQAGEIVVHFPRQGFAVTR